MTAIVNFPTPDTPEMRLSRDVLRNIEHHHVATVMAAINVLSRSTVADDQLLVLNTYCDIRKREALATYDLENKLSDLDAAMYGPPAPRSWATIDSLLAWVCAGAVAGGVGVLIGRALAAWWLA